ncbi:MAG: RIP metalloprotease RseP [Patescibacteria group bacterium]|jgi:regulator of sigma E protease
MSLFIFAIILTVLVFVHELGHFVTARKMGIGVDEFAIGFPPRAIGIKKKNTTYSLNWIPIGGFVKIKGEQGENADDEDSFAHKKIWQRTVVLVAGVAMNILLAFVLLSAGYGIGLPTVIQEVPAGATIRDHKVQIVEVVEDSAAKKSGIQVGDAVVAVDNTSVDTVEAFRNLIKPKVNTEVPVTLKRGDETIETKLTPLPDDAGEGLAGVGLVETGVVRYPVHQAIWMGARTTVNLLWETAKGLFMLVRDLLVSRHVSFDVAGPVGIAVLTGEVSKLGIIYLLQFTALLSINLAVINILPFPALDGGRVLFLIIEKIRRKPVSRNVEAVIHNIGFALLIGLIILVTVKDVSRLSGTIGSFFQRLFGG